MQIPVSNILREKGEWVISIHPEATVYETIARMVEHNVGAIVILDNGTLAGIFTERDYLRRVVLRGRSTESTPVAEVMTPDVITVSPETTVEECMQMMTRHKCRHLPVTREGALAGIISIGDCVKQISRLAEARVEDLTQYITGGYPG